MPVPTPTPTPRPPGPRERGPADHIRRLARVARRYPPVRREGSASVVRIDTHGFGDVYTRLCPVVTVRLPDSGRSVEVSVAFPKANDWLDRGARRSGFDVTAAGEDRELTQDGSPARVAHGLRELSDRFGRMAMRTVRSEPGWDDYLDPNWKWVAARTARALSRLATDIGGRKKYPADEDTDEPDA